MKITLKSIYIFVFLLFPALTYAAGNTYYVTQTGSGDPMSIAEFNALSGTGYAGDTFYFSGTFTTMMEIYVDGTAGNPVIIDGYEAGDCDPLNATCTSSAYLEQGIYIDSTDYVTIQDFRITKTGSAQDIAVYQDLNATVEHFIFRRNFIDDTSCRGIQLGGWYGTHKYIIIEENKITNFAMRNTDPGECTGFVLIEVNHALVRNNIIGHDGGNVGCSYGCNTATLHGCNNILFEYNDVYGAPDQAGLNPKEGGSQQRHIYRFNKIHDNYTFGFAYGSVGDSHDYHYFYGNFVYNNANDSGVEGSYGIGVWIIGDSDYGYFWSNIISDSGDSGFASYVYPSHPSLTPDHIYIYNNTITRSGKIGTNTIYSGVTLNYGSQWYFKNNVFYNNRPTGVGGYHQIYDVVSSSYEHNTLYHDSSTATWYYSGGNRSLSDMHISYAKENDVPAGDVTNPNFTDPDGADNIHGTADDDYTLSSGALTDGADLSQCFTHAVDLSGGDSWMETNSGYGRYIEPCIDDALDPDNTNWTTTPPTVATVKRDTAGWSRGAYAYVGLEKPVPPDDTPPEPPSWRDNMQNPSTTPRIVSSN